MAFEGSGRPLTDAGVVRICDTLECDKATLWALLTVETSGFGFLPDRRPRILFERHIFHKRTAGRFDAAHPDISNADSGGYVFDAGEYPRLSRAITLDETAALESASWGVGQVMGFNFQLAGYRSAKAMVDALVGDEDTQLLACANFIKGNHLAKALRTQEWATFAAGYNGPAYKKNEYDTKLRGFHAKYQTGLPNLALRTAQAALLYLGFKPGMIDGVPGRRTRMALMAFQAGNGLPQTGELDSSTEGRLLAAAFPGEVIGQI